MYLSKLEESKKRDSQLVEKAEKIIQEEKKGVVVDNIESVENIERILSEKESKYNSKNHQYDIKKI